MKIIKFITVIFLINGSVFSQLLKLPLIISDGSSAGRDTLYFGIDPAATDGIDPGLGEYQLPPVPPMGIFDCRFIGSDLNPPLVFGQGIDRDYRNGNSGFTGTKIHELRFQRGTGDNITIYWQLPAGITGRIYDLFGGNIVNDSMHGSGSLVITIAGMNSLFMRINYGPGSIGIKNISQAIPDIYKLYQNYPNPFNPVTSIQFCIPAISNVKITIYDILGNVIAIPVNQQLKPGIFEILWDASDSPSGVYYCFMQAGDFSATRKMILIK